MNIKNTIVRALGLLSVVALLTSCGGGSSDGGVTERALPFTITLSASRTTLTTSNGGAVAPGSDFAEIVTATVRNRDGSAPADGTVVTFSSSNSAVANVSNVDGGSRGSSVAVNTAGGQAQAIVYSLGQAGTVTITGSANDAAVGQTARGTLNFTVEQGAPPDPCAGKRLCINPVSSSIPANPGAGIAFGSPYSTEASITFRDAGGNLTDTTDGEVAVAITPVSLAAFGTLDDPTTDIFEPTELFGNRPVGMASGQATVFVYSLSGRGTVTLSATAQDPITGDNFSDQVQIEIVDSTADGLPAQASFFVPATPQYVQSTGVSTAKTVTISVTDPAGLGVPNPSANNVRVELVTNGNGGGESLRSTNQSGASVSGQSVAVATTNGIAQVALVSGSEPRTVTLRATVDTVDNNVDNGITSPASVEAQAVISDGKLFAVEITQFPQRVLTVEPVDPAVELMREDADDDILPLEPNATYSLRIGIKATDRSGNPPAQAVNLTAGLVDSPMTNFPTPGGFFSVSGTDGDPQEGGTTFTAPGGLFQTAGGGIGPGDTLVLYGDESNAFEDLEGGRQVDQVLGQTSLLVDEPFNFNDVTGSSVNNGPVIPYVIGRARFGSIQTGVNTDINGVAQVQMNYPVSQLGRPASIFVQSQVTDENGVLQTVGDAVITTFAGLAPALYTASPSSIQANTTVDVLVCVQDAAGVPLQGAGIGFAFNLSSGSGSVNGISSGGVIGPTGTDGCTVASVTTSGIPEGSDQGQDGDNILVFGGGEGRAEVMILPPGDTILQAFPSGIVGDGAYNIRLRYLDASGNPISGVQLQGSCEADQGVISINSGPGVTDSDGETIASISVANLDAECPEDDPGMGTCTFTTASDSPSVDVDVVGRSVTALTFSPAPPPAQCEGGDANTITVDVPAGMGAVTSVPSGIACTQAGGNCTATFASSQSVILIATPDLGWRVGDNSTGTNGFTGDCTLDPAFAADDGGTTIPRQSNALAGMMPQTCIVRFTDIP